MMTFKKWGDMNSNYQIHHGDNREVLKNLADNSIDSVVTDPPYELGFMGKSWDATGVAYSVELWQEVMRVLKPGGHLLAFSGSRTYHRMAVAIEDAGFEIRDQIMWIYGSGFPKSHDVSKGIDKQAGAEREVVGEKITGRALGGSNWKDGDAGGQEFVSITTPATAEAKQWQGWGTALKPAHEPIVVARKPLIGTVAANVLTYGTGGLNIDGSRVGNEGGTTGSEYIPNDSPIYGKGLGNTGEVVKLDTGRWPANVIHDGSDEVVELFPDTKAGIARRGNSGGNNFGSDTPKPPLDDIGYSDSGSAARFFYCAKASKRDRNEGLDGFEAKERGLPYQGMQNMDGGRDRLRANHHPTVKPTELMRYLCRLVTPPGGIVLDPFMGSGSTGKAAMYEGFEFVGIELTDEYLPIAKARIEFAIEEMKGRLL
jgi:site-specific DNA-methyltransferase (adenine-specific)